jgi:hypothetical protein
MPYELIPTACAAAAAVVFATWAFRRSGARTALGASLMWFAALTLAGTMALHCGEILYNTINGIEVGMHTRHPNAPQANIFGFNYDFRFYSLQVFGGALIYWSVRLAICAVGLVQASTTAASRAWKNIAYIVVFVLPIVPMHIFAIATVVVAGIAALGLAYALPTAVPLYSRTASSIATMFSTGVRA